MENRPEILSCAADLYQVLLMCTSDFNGNLPAAEVREVLELHGITDRAEQLAALRILREAHAQFRPKPPEVPSG